MGRLEHMILDSIDDMTENELVEALADVRPWLLVAAGEGTHAVPKE